jgi:hypothetical protein
MLRRIGILLIALIAIISFVYVANAQMGEKGSKKTTTLPNGDAIWDLNGEWDGIIEFYGRWSQSGSFPRIVKITQTGSSFVGYKIKKDEPWFPKGEESIRGELDKSGFKKVQIITDPGPLDSRGKISDDGNKMVIDEGERVRLTLTRK